MQQLLMRRPDLKNLPPIPSLPEGYTLRPYAPGDLEGLTALLQSAFEEMDWTVEKVRKSLIDAPDVKRTFVVAHDGEIAATASCRIHPADFHGSGYVHWVGVSAGHRGRGLGEAVSLACLHHFAEMGCADAVLETDDHRLPAIRLYKKLGFEPVHRNESHIERWAAIASELLAAANL
jgi:mycothiol synthase